MEIEQHLANLRAHGPALAEAAVEAGLDAAVPTCPEWAVRDLIGHLGMVHRWAGSLVATARTEPPKPDDDLAQAPDDDELFGWFDDGHRQLVDILTAASDELQCWSFLPAPSPRAFWARRQAHETAIHRVDAESAAGIVSSFDPAFAVDGIDELLLGFFARPRGRLVADPAVTVGVRASDAADSDAWTLVIGPSGREAERGTARGDCVVTGPADELYRMLWNRTGLDRVDVTGDLAVWNLWRDKARVTWG